MRSLKIQRLRETRNPNPYPHKFQGRNIELRDFVEKYKDLKTGEHLKDVEIRAAGRIWRRRDYGTSLEFIDIQGLGRSEEHTSELQSPCNIVCRLLLVKKNKNSTRINSSVKSLDTLT